MSGTPAGHPLDRALALEPLGDDRFAGTSLHPSWGSMVGPFGGITAAAMLQAACGHPGRIGEPVSLTVNFAGLVADGPFEIEARAVRTGRSTQHWTLVLRQPDAKDPARTEVAATGSVVFGHRRTTWSGSDATMPRVPPAGSVPVHPPIAHLPWTHRYEMRFLAGAWPDMARDEELPNADIAVWIRDLPARTLDAPALAAICDAFYPRIFLRRQRFVPAGTVSMTTHFHADAATLAAQGTRSVLGVARAMRYGLGFHDQRADIWGDDGTLLATSTQMVWFKE